MVILTKGDIYSSEHTSRSSRFIPCGQHGSHRNWTEKNDSGIRYALIINRYNWYLSYHLF